MSRIVTLKEIWGRLAETNIPNPPLPGESYRNPSVSDEEIANGQRYNQIVDSAIWNEFFYEMSALLKDLENYGILDYSQLTNYEVGAYVRGQDKEIYRSLKINGPESGNIVIPGTDSETWSEAFGNVLLYPGAFVTVYEQSPPDRMAQRNGAVLYNVSTTYNNLKTELLKPENAWKLKTEAQWQAMRNETPWSGVGGVPYFVVDINADTIRLPDTRGMYEEGSGFDGLTVGGVHGDMIQNITGLYTREFYPQDGTLNLYGAFYATLQGSPPRVISSALTTGTGIRQVGFDASREVPTGNANKPRAFGTLHCIYLG